MKRVGHVVVAGELGGAEQMLRSLATGSNVGVDAFVCVLSPNPQLIPFFRDAGIRVHDGGPAGEDVLSFLTRSLGSRELRWLLEVFREEKPDIVHLHTFGSQVLGTRAAQRHGARIVRTEHSTRVYEDLSCVPFTRYSLKRADAVVAISAHVRAVAVAHAPWVEGRIREIPNGVDTAFFAPSETAKADAFTFVAVGRLEPRKGFDRAIRALGQVPDARLEIVGDGDERERLVTLAGDIGVADCVVFHGYCADPRPMLARAHATLASSRKEGLGIAFLEAMATGLPLVAVPTGGLVELVEHEVSGLLAASDAASDLAAAMTRIATDRDAARAMGVAARARVIERFSVEAMRAAYAAVYASL